MYLLLDCYNCRLNAAAELAFIVESWLVCNDMSRFQYEWDTNPRRAYEQSNHA